MRELAREQAELVRLRPGADGQIGFASDQVAAFAADLDLNRQAGQLAVVSSYPLPDLSNSRSPSAPSVETVIEIACAHGFHAEELGRSGTREFWINKHLLFELVTAEARISSALAAYRSLRSRNIALDTPLIVPEQKRVDFTAVSERLAVAVDK